MTAEPIEAFRVDFRTVGKPHRGYYSEAEAIAAQRVADWINGNVRPINYRVIDVASIPEGEWITLEAARQGARLVAAGVGDRLLMSKSRDSNSPNRGMLTLAAMQRIFAEESAVGSLEFPLWDVGLSKPHAHHELPSELMDLTIWCKRARVEDGVIVPCGRCPTGCKYNALIRDLLAQGYIPEAIYDYAQRLMRKGPYSDLPVTDPSWYCGPYSDAVDIPETRSA
ncbi:MAG: hypothetical protein AB7P12_03445 [Alphaproteobacteria bacterium]